jgi:hypothetical protein
VIPARRLLLVLVVACATLLPACSAAPAPPAPPPTTTVPTVPTEPTTPPQAAPTPAAAAVELPWPASGQAAAALQEQVDAGSQPWLLDPAELARSFAATAYGWPEVTVEPNGEKSVEVSGPSGGRAVLTVDQPVRSGPGGIWVVTAATRS